jgi:hypothetical protein
VRIGKIVDVYGSFAVEKLRLSACLIRSVRG